ncbi:MAG: M14 family zinc carboxypeptidase [Myxococcota bacterium]
MGVAFQVLVLSGLGWAAEPLAEAWVDADALRDLPDRSGIGFAEGERLRDGVRQVRVLVEPSRLGSLPLVDVRADHRRAAPAGYRSPEEAGRWLAEIALGSTRAGTARYGTSVEGRPIDALWVGVRPELGAPSIRVLAAHHGDEPASAELALALAESLVAEGDPRIGPVLDRATVWIVPFVNPDGVAHGVRINANGVDLNRNYDYQWSARELRPGAGPFSEPETRAVRAAATFERPMASLTLHTGATNIGWPWNYTVVDPADAASFGDIASRYADHVDDPEFWITQGSEWYPTWGDTNDWAYGRYGGLDLTVEVAQSDPEAGDLPAVIAPHLDAILGWLDTPPDLEGAVVDAESGAPVEAMVEVVGFGRAFPTDAATGRFARWLPSDVVPELLQVSATGYQTVWVAPTASIALPRSGISSERAEPTVLWEAAALEVPGGSGTLERPGAEPVAFGPGQRLDPAALTPGPWSVVLDGGRVLPRAVLVEDASAASLRGWSVEDGELVLLGAGFGAGARAWALSGLERVPTEVEVTTIEETRLTIDAGGLPDADPVDVVLWTNGSILALSDARAGGERPSALSTRFAGGGCACAAVSTRSSPPGRHLRPGPWSMFGAAWFAGRRRLSRVRPVHLVRVRGAGG